MEYVFYFIVLVFGWFGWGLISSAFKSKSLGLAFGGLCYLGAAAAAMTLSSWWPFLIGFVLAWVIRFLGGDPSYKNTNNE